MFAADNPILACCGAAVSGWGLEVAEPQAPALRRPGLGTTDPQARRQSQP
jgi:hypothetical protein